MVSILQHNCHRVLLSRFVPDILLIDMVAGGEVLPIGQDELRLTAEETGQLGSALIGSAPTGAKVEKLLRRLEGWPAGTVLAFQPLSADLEHAILVEGKGPEALFEVLARAMLNAQPQEIRQFLLASSTLTRLTPELCSAILKHPGSKRLLDVIQAPNLFVSRMSVRLVDPRLFSNLLRRQVT